MADNVAVTAGSGTTVATDDVAGVHYQRVKLDIGPDGTSNPLANPTVSTGTSVTATAADTSVLVANTSRKSFFVYNDGTAIVAIKLGTSMSSVTDFTFELTPGAFYESQFPTYTGAIRAWSTSGSQALRITELT